MSQWTTQGHSPEFTWWKDSADSHTLSTDLCVHTRAHTYTQINTNKCKVPTWREKKQERHKEHSRSEEELFKGSRMHKSSHGHGQNPQGPGQCWSRSLVVSSPELCFNFSILLAHLHVLTSRAQRWLSQGPMQHSYRVQQKRGLVRLGWYVVSGLARHPKSLCALLWESVANSSCPSQNEQSWGLRLPSQVTFGSCVVPAWVPVAALKGHPRSLPPVLWGREREVEILGGSLFLTGASNTFPFVEFQNQNWLQSNQVCFMLLLLAVLCPTEASPNIPDSFLRPLCSLPLTPIPPLEVFWNTLPRFLWDPAYRNVP